jgi:anti-sigma-K factor RskA
VKMNEEQLLQLQAWVDGELPEGEARRLERQIETDPEARALVQELKMTKAFLAGNEPEYTVPDSREFYWSQVKREIVRQAAASAQPADSRPAWTLGWRRFLAPVAGLALIAFLTVLSLNIVERPKLDESLQHLVEVENLDEHVGSMDYKSQAENMFVVYLYNKDLEPAADEESDMEDDAVLQ